LPVSSDLVCSSVALGPLTNCVNRAYLVPANPQNILNTTQSQAPSLGQIPALIKIKIYIRYLYFII
jgi:hypothetical protein